MLAQWIRRWRYLWNRKERARLLAEELRAHLVLHVEELMAEGVPRSEAEMQARRRFGSMARTQEEARGVWIARWAEDLVQDMRYATRNLRRAPGFAGVAILSAALGIGACSTIFAIANFALFRPPAVPDPDRLVSISRTNRGRPGSTVSYPDVMDLRGRGTLASVAAMFPLVAANVGSVTDAQRHFGWLVTANYFDVLGLTLHRGRGFSGVEDDRPGAAPVIVLSHNLWLRRFGGDASLVGREIHFNGQKVTVAGVAPPGFRGHEVALVADFWIPLSMLDRIAFPKGSFERLQRREGGWLLTVGRLRGGASIAQAQADLTVLSSQLQRQYPEHFKDRGFHVERAGQLAYGFRQIMKIFFVLLLAVALLVLLIACANVASLLLARAASRHREIATRLAIGAGRFRLVRQLLAESVLLASLGGLGGIAVAYGGAAMIGRFRLPVQLPLDLGIGVDFRVVLFAAGLSVMTGVAFGLAPALQATRPDLTGGLKSESLIVAGRRRLSLRNFLVVAQVAVSIVLLIASGLFLRSLSTAQGMDIGIRARNVLFVGVDPTLNNYPSERTRAFLDTLMTRVAAVPGVRSASYTNLLPLSFVGATGGFTADDKRNEPERSIDAQQVMIGPRFFETLEIAFLRGQDFGSEQPDGDPVAIINEAFARKAFPGQDPIGRRIYHGNDGYRVVGLVATAKTRTIGEDPVPQVYNPVSQVIDKEDMPMGLALAIKTENEPSSHLPAVRQEIAALDPTLAIFDIKTMRTHLRNALLLPRLGALMFGLCGGMGLLIAAIGLYGVVSFAVARRSKELGIRMALGARPGQVVVMVLKSGLVLALIGAVLGVGLALACMRLAVSLLYGISPSDPVTFVMVPLFLIGVATVATLIPARRAANLDPLTTLRYE